MFKVHVFSFVHPVPSSNTIWMFTQDGESGNGYSANADTADNVWRTTQKRIGIRERDRGDVCMDGLSGETASP